MGDTDQLEDLVFTHQLVLGWNHWRHGAARRSCLYSTAGSMNGATGDLEQLGNLGLQEQKLNQILISCSWRTALQISGAARVFTHRRTRISRMQRRTRISRIQRKTRISRIQRRTRIPRIPDAVPLEMLLLPESSSHIWAARRFNQTYDSRSRTWYWRVCSLQTALHISVVEIAAGHKGELRLPGHIG